MSRKCCLTIATVLLFCECLADPNTTEDIVADNSVCEGKDSCQPDVTADAWVPFRYKGAKWVDTAVLLKKYARWHNKTLYDAEIPCQEKLSVVFKPNAGLGDSFGAITGAFIEAVKTGRLFFINWQPYPWTVGLKPLSFLYEYAKAKKLTDPSTGKPLLCVDEARAPGSSVEGHLHQQHALLTQPTINDVLFPYDDVIKTMIQPSTKVREIMNSTLKRNSETDSPNRLVALVIRTGQGEYNQFLSPGDELNFVKCFQAYAKTEPGVRFKVFVTSDVDDVKQNVVRALSGDEGVEVVTLNESNVHVMHLSKDEAKDKIIRDKLRKTYAEFFLIGKCEVLFLTHGSLFGRTAAEQGGARENDMHYISDSQCDGHREKYSYLQCHKPKYPKICQLE